MVKQVVSVFGLGSMGFGVASSALAYGHDVFGFDIDPQRQASFVAKGGQSGCALAAKVFRCSYFGCVEWRAN